MALVKLLLSCTAPEGWESWYAAVVVDEEVRKKIIQRRQLFIETRAKDDCVSLLTFYDTTPTWYTDYDAEGAFGEDVAEALSNDLYALIPAHEEVDEEPRSTDMDRMVVTDTDIWWVCAPKHGDGAIETFALPYEVFLGEKPT